MTRALLAALVCLVAGLAIGAPPPQKKAATPQKKTPVTTAAKTPAKTAPKTAAKSSTAANSAAKSPAKTTSRNTASRRTYYRQPVRRAAVPQQPTSDRFREIQDALAAKGYLSTPSTGVWDKDSVAAMQRFQQDQKLEPTGKLTARSLVALGLGPKNPATTQPVTSSIAAPAPVASSNALPAQ
jgi:hypothetical protein